MLHTVERQGVPLTYVLDLERSACAPASVTAVGACGDARVAPAASPIAGRAITRAEHDERRDDIYRVMRAQQNGGGNHQHVEDDEQRTSCDAGGTPT